MKRNVIVILLLVAMPTLLTKGQSIKDYVIPPILFNKVKFFEPDQTGQKTSIARNIYYTINGDICDIMDVSLMDGNPMSIITKSVVFTDNEVRMTKSVATNPMATNKKKFYDPPSVILKMPQQGQTVTWTYTDISGDDIKCTASWTTVKVSSKPQKAIKVKKTIVGAENWGKTIEYYVNGIGLWKTELLGSDGKTKIFDKYDGLEFDPEAK